MLILVLENLHSFNHVRAEQWRLTYSVYDMLVLIVCIRFVMMVIMVAHVQLLALYPSFLSSPSSANDVRQYGQKSLERSHWSTQSVWKQWLQGNVRSFSPLS